jgi:hypothetical protein
MSILNFSISKDFKPSVSILVTIVFLLAVWTCSLEDFLPAQPNQSVASLHHETTGFKSEDSETTPYHAHDSSHTDEEGEPCCSQILATHRSKSVTQPLANSGQMTIPFFVVNSTELSAKPNQLDENNIFINTLPVLVHKENSYYFASPSHAPPSLS